MKMPDYFFENAICIFIGIFVACIPAIIVWVFQ